MPVGVVDDAGILSEEVPVELRRLDSEERSRKGTESCLEPEEKMRGEEMEPACVEQKSAARRLVTVAEEG